MKMRKLGLVLALTTTLFACKKDNDDRGLQPATPTKGVYVLSEGNFFANNTKLGFYSLENQSFTGDYFQQQNPTMTGGLGDLGSDMFIYGGKLYIVVNNSNTVTVLNATTGQHLRNIAFTPAAKQPRFGLGVHGYVYVTAYDGTVNVIDTSSLSIVHSIDVGSNPEGIAVSANHLYVANGGGLNYPTYDSTVSVVSLNTWQEIAKITVSKNPFSIAADELGNIYVSCIGNYADVPASLHKINTSTLQVTFSADTAVGVIKYHNNHLYVTGGYLGVNKIRKLNTINFAQTASDFIIDGTQLIRPYGIGIDITNNDVYVTDAKDFISSGEVFCFDANGRKKFSFLTTPGINPMSIAFLH